MNERDDDLIDEIIDNHPSSDNQSASDSTASAAAQGTQGAADATAADSAAEAPENDCNDEYRDPWADTHPQVRQAVMLARRAVEQARSVDELNNALKSHDISLHYADDNSDQIIARVQGVPVPAEWINPDLATGQCYKHLHNRLKQGEQQQAQAYEQGMRESAPLRTSLASLAYRGGRWMTRYLHPNGTPEQRAQIHLQRFENSLDHAAKLLSKIHADPTVTQHQNAYNQARETGDENQMDQVRTTLRNLVASGQVGRDTKQYIHSLDQALTAAQQSADRCIDTMHRNADSIPAETAREAERTITSKFAQTEKQAANSVVPTNDKGETLSERISEMARSIADSFERFVNRILGGVRNSQDMHA